MRYLLTTGLALILGIATIHWGSRHVLPPALATIWIDELYRIKIERMKTTLAPRIVVVGGSEVHFGISARILEQETGIAAVNFGTHGALMWEAIFHKVEPLLERDDIVLFALNRSNLFSRKSNSVMNDYTKSHPNLLLLRPVTQWPDMIGWDVADAAVTRLFEFLARKNNLRVAGNIDSRGDETRNTSSNERQRKKILSDEIRARNNPFFRVKPRATDQILVLRDFVIRLESRGIRTMLFWPPTLDSKAFHKARNREVYSQWPDVFSALDLRVLNRPDDFLLPHESMFDSISHPNDEGRKKVTNQLAGLLKTQLNRY